MRSAAVVVAALMVAAALPASAQGSFSDDDGRPAEPALEWLAERGVIDGCDPPQHRRACPDRPLSRVQAAKILVQAARVEGILAEERPGTADHFADDDTTWEGTAQPFVNHLADLGVVHGCDPPANASFCPQEILRRGEVIKMLVRTFSLAAPADYPTPWTDTEGEFFSEAARVAAYHGLLDDSAGLFDGWARVSRGEFARLVVRAFQPGLCADDPFRADRVADLEERHPGVSFTAYAHDLDTGCAYALNPRHRQPTASVLKVMVMGGTFLEAQQAGRDLTAQERAWLDPMITRSANPPVRDLWRSFGGAPWFARQAERFALSETAPVGDHGRPWGRTTTSAYDQGRLLRQVLLGHERRVDPSFRREAFELMTSVVPSQTWGATAGVPAGWTVAQKNGFAAQTANSVGVVYDTDGKADYLVAILTHGWPVWQDGVPSVERIGSWVSSSLAG